MLSEAVLIATSLSGGALAVYLSIKTSWLHLFTSMGIGACVGVIVGWKILESREVTGRYRHARRAILKVQAHPIMRALAEDRQDFGAVVAWIDQHYSKEQWPRIEAFEELVNLNTQLINSSHDLWVVNRDASKEASELVPLKELEQLMQEATEMTKLVDQAMKGLKQDESWRLRSTPSTKRTKRNPKNQRIPKSPSNLIQRNLNL